MHMQQRTSKRLAVPTRAGAGATMCDCRTSACAHDMNVVTGADGLLGLVDKCLRPPYSLHRTLH